MPGPLSKLLFSLFIAVLGLLFVARSCLAKTIIVAKSGGDYSSIQTAINNASGTADTIFIKPGTYNEQVTLTSSKSGTSSQNFVIAAYPGNECVKAGQGKTCQVIIDGTGKSGGDGLFYINGVSYVKISGIEVANTSSGYTAGFYLNNAHNITLDNNMTVNTGSSGIGVWSGSSYIYITNNAVVNAQIDPLPTSVYGDENISLDSTTNFEVSGNEVYNTPPLDRGNGRYAIGICIKSSSQHGKVYGNYIHDMPAEPGMYIDAWQSSTLQDIQYYQNRMYNLLNGISVSGECGGQVQNLKIYNNTISHVSSGGISVTDIVGNVCGSGNGYKKNVYIDNNTIYDATDNGMGGIYIYSSNLDQVYIRNNIVSYGGTNGQIRIANRDSLLGSKVFVSNNLTDKSSSYPSEEASGAIKTSDIKFMNAANQDFHLQSSSPAVNAGVAIDYFSIDFDGVSRPQGVVWDIGAYEYGGSAPSVTPTPTSTPTPSCGAGDVSCDGKVNIVDVGIIIDNYGSSNPANPRADQNADGVVNIVDLGIVIDNYGV